MLDCWDSHYAQRNEKSFADFLRAPIVDGDRRSIGGITWAGFDLPGMTLQLARDECV